jgi:hypothetical protein
MNDEVCGSPSAVEPAGGALRPELERLVDLLAIQEGVEERRQAARIETLRAVGDLSPRPPAEVEVVI